MRNTPTFFSCLAGTKGSNLYAAKHNSNVVEEGVAASKNPPTLQTEILKL